MKKTFSTLFACMAIVFAGPAAADNHGSGVLGYGQFIQFNVSDPQAMVAAMTKFRTSALGKKNPSSVSLRQVVSGGTGASHVVGVLYDSAADLFPGNVYFGNVIADGDSSATHFVTFAAKDMATLLDGMEKVNTSEAMTRYFAKAPSFRTVTSESISAVVVGFPAP